MYFKLFKYKIKSNDPRTKSWGTLMIFDDILLASDYLCGLWSR